MADIDVRFFANLREVVGRERVAINAENASSLQMLLRQLGDVLDGAALSALTDDSVRIAVNQELVEGDVALSAGDEVAFLPPVTGG